MTRLKVIRFRKRSLIYGILVATIGLTGTAFTQTTTTPTKSTTVTKKAPTKTPRRKRICRLDESYKNCDASGVSCICPHAPEHH